MGSNTIPCTGEASTSPIATSSKSISLLSLPNEILINILQEAPNPLCAFNLACLSPLLYQIWKKYKLEDYWEAKQLANECFDVIIFSKARLGKKPGPWSSIPSARLSNALRRRIMEVVASREQLLHPKNDDLIFPRHQLATMRAALDLFQSILKVLRVDRLYLTNTVEAETVHGPDYSIYNFIHSEELSLSYAGVPGASFSPRAGHQLHPVWSMYGNPSPDPFFESRLYAIANRKSSPFIRMARSIGDPFHRFGDGPKQLDLRERNWTQRPEDLAKMRLA